MPDESAIDIGKAVEGTGKGLEHAMNGAGTFAERIHGLTRDCLLPHKAKKQVEAARAKANGAISILEETGAEVTEKDRRAIAFFAMMDIKGFDNVEKTINMIDIPDGSRIPEIDDEWISQFVDAASKAFSNWKRRMIADAASEKAVDPRSISIAALACIAKMEEHHMEAFKAVCSLRPIVNGERVDPLILSLDNDLLGIVNLNAEDLEALRGIGLLRKSTTRNRKMAVYSVEVFERLGGNASQICDHEGGSLYGEASFDFGDIAVRAPVIHVESVEIEDVINRTRGRNYVDYGIVELTEQGKELASLINPQTPDTIREYITNGMEAVQREEHASNPRTAFIERRYKEKLIDFLGLGKK